MQLFQVTSTMPRIGFISFESLTSMVYIFFRYFVLQSIDRRLNFINNNSLTLPCFPDNETKQLAVFWPPRHPSHEKKVGRVSHNAP